MKSETAITSRGGTSAHVEKLASLDFETRSAADLRKVGAYKYATDPTTRVLCLAYRLPGRKVELWSPRTHDFLDPEDLHSYLESGGLIEAHNAGFEYAIWNYYCVPRLGWPKLHLSQLRCSAAKASALALPRDLGELSAALNLPVQKDMEGRRLMLKMSRPRKPTKNNPALWHDDAADYERLFAYCERDVKTEDAASAVMPDLIPAEQDLWELSERMNERGIYCDVPLCETARDFCLRFEKELLEDFRQVTGGAVQTVKQIDKFQAWLKAQGVSLPDLAAQTVTDALQTELPEKARAALSIRQRLAKASIKKFDAMIAMAGSDSRIRGTLMYHGASTGRYTGKGIQPQNYVKPKIKNVDEIFEVLSERDYEWFRTLYPDVFTALSSTLRGMLCAAPGNELDSGDFNAIEARVVLWLAEDTENLALWKSGADAYKYMAMDIYGVPFEKVTDAQRDMGKRVILGCGFSMGHEKFKNTCWEQGRVVVSEELAKRAVAAYRERHSAVVDFWYGLDRAAIAAVKRPGTVIKFKRLKLAVKGDFLFIKLPSGRKLAYYKPRIRTAQKKWGAREELCYLAVHPKTHKFVSEGTYGGKLTENVVQATARDIMTDAMKRLEPAGYPPIMTSHDEVTSERKAGTGSHEEFIAIMAQPPAWGLDIPLKVSGWRGKRYRK